MKYYFELRLRIMRRQIEETGLPVYLAISLIVFLYLVLWFARLKSPTNILFILSIIPLYILSRQAQPSRVDFLKNICSKQLFTRIRLVENLCCILPFIPFALWDRQWLLLLFYAAIFILFSFFPVKTMEIQPIRTPFRKSAFEFIVLSRRYWPYWAMAFIISCISLYYGNTALPLVLLGIVILSSTSAYEIIEDEYVLWNNSRSARDFLRNKIGTGCLQLCTLLVPFVLLHLFFMPQSLAWTFLCCLVGCLLLILMILMKYAVYPNRIGINEVIVLMASGVIPLFILAIYPYYYRRAIKNLEKYL